MLKLGRPCAMLQQHTHIHCIGFTLLAVYLHIIEFMAAVDQVPHTCSYSSGNEHYGSSMLFSCWLYARQCHGMQFVRGDDLRDLMTHWQLPDETLSSTPPPASKKTPTQTTDLMLTRLKLLELMSVKYKYH